MFLRDAVQTHKTHISILTRTCRTTKKRGKKDTHMYLAHISIGNAKMQNILLKVTIVELFYYFKHFLDIGIEMIFCIDFSLSTMTGLSWPYVTEKKSWGNFRCLALPTVDPRGQHSIRDHLLRLTRATRVRGGRPQFYFGFILHCNPHKYNVCINVKLIIIFSFVFFRFTVYFYIYAYWL